MTAQVVLVVDDDSIVRDVLDRYLVRSGYAVHTAADGPAAIQAFRRCDPDLVLLDLMLPGVDGFGVMDAIRSDASTPVIMLTARGNEEDRIAGFQYGADDYVAKPFAPREVVLRVQAVLHRAQPVRRTETLVFEDLVIDGPAREVRVRGANVELTPKEFDVLFLLALHPRRVFSRLDILEHLWDFAFEGDPSTVTVHVRRLREKIEADPSQPRHLVTVWGTGYRFDP